MRFVYDSCLPNHSPLIIYDTCHGRFESPATSSGNVTAVNTDSEDGEPATDPKRQSTSVNTDVNTKRHG